jgi:ATP-dependent Clp protease protease subunit
LKKLIIDYFSRHTGKDQGQIALDMERDFYMPALEAVSYGVVDKILTRDKNGATS